MASLTPVTAAGGVVYNDNGQVLLIFRRGVWDLPKGKLENGETVEECAVREVAEEIGIPTPPEITYTLAETYHEYEQQGIQYGKTTHWFGMRLAVTPNNGFDPETKEGIEQVKWVELSKAKILVGYKNLNNVLTSFEQLHAS